MKRLIYFVFLISLIGCNHPESKKYERYGESSITEPIPVFENTEGYKVIGIKDGDTFVVLIDGKEQSVRLEHIDCPEKKQPFGSKAKQFASDLCFGKYVQLNEKKKYDRNKRLISEIILNNGINVNKELVKNGLAWHFKKYSKDNDYSELEINARNNQIGIWSESNPIAPWDWRKR